MGLLDFILKFIGSNKKNTQIIAQDLSKIYKGSEALEVGLYSDKQPLTNKTIEIEINGRTYNRITDNNGIAKLNINLPVGKYKTFFTFKGDNEYKSSKGHVQVFVNPKIETSDLNMSEKDGSKFTATLKDNDGNLLTNTDINFTVNGRTYSRKSDEQGKASLNINLSKGQYHIATSINDISIENIITIEEPKIVEPPKVDKHFGYWIFGRDMYNVDLDSFKNNNVTDIFLNFYAFTAHGENKTKEWIKQVNAKGIKVHIWMQVFYDGEWHNPVGMDLSSRIEEAKQYASIEGVSGVHLDYFRYPGNAYKTDGGADAITNFARQMREAVPNVILSCAVMPENETKYYYGQDIEALGQIMDVILPMQYKGNYEAGSSWLASTSKMFSGVATIWSGLQSYKSDDDTTVLSNSELLNDISTCIDNGAKGAILFRYGLSPDINFPGVPAPTQPSAPTSVKSTRMEGTDINMTFQDGTQYQCAVYDDIGRVAGTVNIEVNGRTYQRTPDNEGLYKLNINLPVGTYTITSSYSGDATHLPSSVQNTVTINEAPVQSPKSEPVQLYDYFTNEGGGYLGQRTGYTCGPHSLMQCIHRLTGEDVSEMTLASVAGTTTDGTDHDGLATALAWFNKQYGYNLKMTWKNFSEVGFEGTQQLIDNGACFHHILYRDQYGHYEVPKWTNGDPIYVLNSLGSSCGDGYCGYIEERSRSTHQSYINGISQKSVCIITRE